MAYRLLGSGTTDANGKATYTYTGVGAGELDVVASLDNPIVSGSVQSEPYPIEDDLFYDDGITEPSVNHWINSNFTVTRDTNGTTLSATQYATYFANMNGTSTSEFDFVTPFAVECHIISCGSVSGMQIYDNSNNFSLSLPTFITTGNQDLRIENNGSQIKLYVDNVLKNTYNYSMGTCRVGFRIATSSTLSEAQSIVWKNFKIKPL